MQHFAVALPSERERGRSRVGRGREAKRSSSRGIRNGIHQIDEGNGIGRRVTVLRGHRDRYERVDQDEEAVAEEEEQEEEEEGRCCSVRRALHEGYDRCPEIKGLPTERNKVSQSRWRPACSNVIGCGSAGGALFVAHRPDARFFSRARYPLSTPLFSGESFWIPAIGERE